MNVKGGIAYVDFTNVNIASAGTFTKPNIFNDIKKAYESKKIIAIHNAIMTDEVIPDVIPSSVRKRDDTHYVFYIVLSSKVSSGSASHYCVIDSEDLITII